jgi:putative ABC transport system permease protein
MAGVSVLIGVASRSLRYRLSGVVLTIASVALSVFVLLAVEHVRQEARNGFASTVSGVDLIVGARTGEVNLLLLSVFRIGTATANVSWSSLEQIRAQNNVSWTVPLSLGDSHRSFRVVGTTQEFFERYKHGAQQSLGFSQGVRFDALNDVVLGAQVASRLGYELGDSIVLSHGMADTSFTHLDQLPFRVSGILSLTGTPVDNALFVALDAIEALHSEEEGGDRPVQGVSEHEHEQNNHEYGDEHGHHDHHDEVEDHDDHRGHGEHAESAYSSASTEADHAAADHGHDHPPIGTVTAVLVGLNSPIATLQVKRWVDTFSDEALLAILPGVALTQLWELVGNVEIILLGISILVFLSSVLGLNAMLFASMRERRSEIEVLRNIGAPSLFVLGLLMVEALLIVTTGIALAILGLLLSIAFANAVFAQELGLMLSYQIFNSSNLLALALIYLTTLILTAIPALQAYRLSVSVGGSPKEN